MLRLILVPLLATALYAGTVNYNYDTAGRLIRADYGSGVSISYSYDASGNLLSRTVTTIPTAAQLARDAKSPGPKSRHVIRPVPRIKNTPRVSRAVDLLHH